MPVVLAEWHQVASLADLPTTQRDSGGFGSTGIGVSDGSGADEYRQRVAALDAHFMKKALLEGERSNCVRGCLLDDQGVPQLDAAGHMIGATRNIGCVIVINGSVVADGHNAQYPGAKPCREIGCIRERQKIPSGTMLEVCQAIHAEDMAINNALGNGVQLRDSHAVMYCTHPPCRNCARKIAGLELEALVVIEGNYSPEGLDMVRASGTIVRVIPDPSP